eukprot:1949879-Karenia_brevis.AAC.1
MYKTAKEYLAMTSGGTKEAWNGAWQTLNLNAVTSWAAAIEEAVLGTRHGHRSRYLVWNTRMSSRLHPEFQADVTA